MVYVNLVLNIIQTHIFQFFIKNEGAGILWKTNFNKGVHPSVIQWVIVMNSVFNNQVWIQLYKIIIHIFTKNNSENSRQSVWLSIFNDFITNYVGNLFYY